MIPKLKAKLINWISCLYFKLSKRIKEISFESNQIMENMIMRHNKVKKNEFVIIEFLYDFF